MEVEKNYINPNEQPRGSSARLMFFLELYRRIITGKNNIVGEENLEKLPPDAPIIFATTHITDIDVPLVVAALGNKFDLATVDMSVHRRIGASVRVLDPTILGIWLAGVGNFLSISYTQENGVRKGLIDPVNLDRIGQTLKSGKKALVMSAHNPVLDRKAYGKLPDNPGYAVIRVAQSVENAVVVPVVVQVGEGINRLGYGNNILETIYRRPSVKVIIGRHLVFNNPEAKQAAAVFEEIMVRRQQGQEEAGDRKRMVEAREVVNTEGARLMEALAAMLPPEKRGKWGNDTTTPPIS